MADFINKQLTAKVNGVNTNVYPYTNTDAVIDENNKTLTNILEDIDESINDLEKKHKHFINKSEKASANGVATLDAMGKVPKEQLPDDLSGNAVDIKYDNTTSNLKATNIQEAIDEIMAEGVGNEAEDITYDNTTSKLEATTLQEAIDELVESVGEGGETPGATYVDFSGDVSVGAVEQIDADTLGGYSADDFIKAGEIDLDGISIDGMVYVKDDEEDTEVGAIEGNDYHQHTNKDVLDKFSTSESGTLLFNGQKIEGSGEYGNAPDGVTYINFDDSIEAGELAAIDADLLGGHPVSDFVMKTVDNLDNYYNKNETYTKIEVNNLLDTISSLQLTKVDVLPTDKISTSTIYLLPKTDAEEQNIYLEYINLDGTSNGWECIGDTSLNLTDYITSNSLTIALSDYYKKSNAYSKTEVDSLIENIIDGTTPVGNSLALGNETAEEWQGKIDNIQDNYQVKNGTSYLASAFDANTFTDSGRYTHGVSSLGTNIPSTGTFIVENCGSYILQRVTDENTGKTYVRSSADKGATWKPWNELLTTKGGTVGDGTSTAPMKIKGNISTAYMQFINNANAVLGYLGMRSATEPVYVPSAGNVSYDLLHTGNKPTGSYTGNGSATSRTISIGALVGTNNALLIDSEYGLCVVTQYRATCFRNGEVTTVSGSEASFNGTNLKLATTNGFLNTSGRVYYYTVL